MAKFNLGNLLKIYQTVRPLIRARRYYFRNKAEGMGKKEALLKAAMDAGVNPLDLFHDLKKGSGDFGDVGASDILNMAARFTDNRFGAAGGSVLEETEQWNR